MSYETDKGQEYSWTIHFKFPRRPKLIDLVKKMGGECYLAMRR